MNLTVNEHGPAGAPSLIFFHGLGVSSWMWHEQIEALKADFHCLTVDLPGSGDNAAVPWTSFADTADLLADVIRQRASGGRAHVIGLSLGGYTALTLLARQPAVVLSTLISGVTGRPLANPLLIKPMSFLMARALKWTPLINLSARMMQLPDEVLPLYRRDAKRQAPDMVYRVYDEVGAFTLPPGLAESTTPLLAVAGAKEASMVRASLPDFAALHQHSQAALVPDAHHGWNGEFPELFTDLVRVWVTDAALPAALQPVAAPSGQLLAAA